MYKKLNPAQKKAVDTIDGPVMVIAGPGTGKTRILTLRIANILKKTDTAPDSILALTFTESGAYSMRKNLANIIGSAAYRVNISTFHGFCNQIIKEYPEYFETIIGSINISTAEQIQILEDALVGSRFDILKPSGNNFYYLYPALRKISELKKDGITPKEFTGLIDKEEKNIQSQKDLYHTKGVYKGKVRGVYAKRIHDLEKSRELAKLYMKYQKVLRDKHLYDYEDMIMEVLYTLTRRKELRLSLQEEFQYILADEHQDVNRAQNKVLELLSEFHAPYPNLFIVGDEKQAIFRFQGASLDNFLYFHRLYPHALLIHLDTNYRSAQAILDAAHDLIGEDTGNPIAKRIRLRAGRKDTKPKGSPVQLYGFSTPTLEHLFIQKKVRDLITKDKVHPGEIAILYRDNKDAHALSDILSSAAIPFTIESDHSIFDDVDIHKLIQLLQAIHTFGDDAYLGEILYFDFLKINPLDIHKINTYARKSHSGVYDIISSEKKLKKAGCEDISRIIALYSNLSKWNSASRNKAFHDFFDKVVHESGFLTYILSSDDTIEKMDTVTALYEEVARLAERHSHYMLRDFITYLDLVSRYGLRVSKRDNPIYLEHVHLMTAHKSKGLEFSHVFITGVQDKHWGGRTSRDYFPVSYISSDKGNEGDDERRLFYVALTRARKAVYITYAYTGLDGSQKLPSRFIEEIDDKLIDDISTKPIEARLAKQKHHIFSQNSGKSTKSKEKEYLVTLFNEYGLSVTALNNYLKCPWKYFYNNLIRIPQVQTPQQIYGTAVHEALRRLFDLYKEEKKITKKMFLDFFTMALSRFPMSDYNLEEFLKRGRDSLCGYYQKYHKTFSKNILTEFPINDVRIGDVGLTGKLDKVEFITEHEVNVVDYKTGKPRSRAYIEGDTKGSQGDYKRQLVFYKLLISLYKPRNLKFVSGEIDYIEPDQKGEYRREKFTVSEAEVAELKKEIKRIATEIRDLSFWNMTCDDKQCQYCILRRLHT